MGITLFLRGASPRVHGRSRLLEFDEDRSLAVFWVSCEAGTYVSKS